MKRAIYYFYYRLFDMHSRGEVVSLGAFLAVITTSFIFWLNIFTISGFLRKVNILPTFFNKTNWIAFLITLFAIDYFLFMHKKKYEKIIQMFKDETRGEKVKNSLFVLLYIFLSIAVFIIMVLYKPGKL
jgi:hypothetical protein